MANLYQMTGELADLMAMLEDPDADQLEIEDKIQNLTGSLEDKMDGYAKVYRTLLTNAEAYKSEIERLEKLKKTAENSSDRIKNTLLLTMQVSKKSSLKTKLFNFTLKNTAPILVIDDEESIPEDYWIEQPPKLDRKGLLKFVKDKKGKTPYAHTEVKQSLMIK